MSGKLIVIGAGPGGYETAARAARAGLQVTLVTSGPLGGTCLNKGCIPTKTLCRFADSLSDSSSDCCGLRPGRRFGDSLNTPPSRPQPQQEQPMEQIKAEINRVVNQLRSGVASILKGVEIIYGRARFTGPLTVSVQILDPVSFAPVAGTAPLELAADRIIIATGSHSASLQIPGAELALGSDDILNLESVPETLCVVGGGVIGLEFASIYAALGSSVTVLEYCPQILPRFDTDLSKRLKAALAKRGVTFALGAEVKSIEDAGGYRRVHYSLKGADCVLDAEKVLMAVGRRPSVDDLGLDAAGITYSPKGIAVDTCFRTTVPGVYAVGDVTGGYMLAHVASAQGMTALADILGNESLKPDMSVVPAAVFTFPELASVGLTEEDCVSRGIEYRALKSSFRANGKAVSMGEDDGYCKVLADPSGHILGAHILGAHASDLIHEAAVLISLGATVAQAARVIHAHPTLSEVLLSAFRQGVE